MRTTKTIVKMTETNVLDLRTGEVVQQTSSNVYQLPTEPAYVKLYIDDLCSIVQAPDALKRLLLLMIRRLDYEGFIVFSPRSRREMAETLGWTSTTFRNRLSELCKAGLVERHSQNEYLANPQYFARGEWKRILANREAFELRITYGAKGRSIKTRGVAEDDGSGQQDLGLE